MKMRLPVIPMRCPSPTCCRITTVFAVYVRFMQPNPFWCTEPRVPPDGTSQSMELSMRNLLLASLLATVAATPAMAQDAAPFTGPRVEALVGGDRLQNNGHDDDLMYGVAAG